MGLLPLYRVVQENWKTFEAEAEAERDGMPLPRYVREEFEAYLRCGILAHGFLRAKCNACRHERLVALSCKRRGFCPSCAARRMNESAAFWVDHVVPDVPVRQWVLSAPVPLRIAMARSPGVLGEVLRIFQRVVMASYRRRARDWQ